ncbi:hypothetical protein AMS68_000197 [Peltaster fructicola]|uniref:Serine/threonine-protein kinase TEL1 n=1 Tax=Peltaster fructicola TaxID=286661 RepID=A0A6H0XJH7_9PEZI|nr:hypothetical protein AMS68_000197 [Peltaster fructicola]
MASQINLGDILNALEHGSIKTRSDNLQDLKHLLRHNLENNSLDPLDDRAYQSIFDTLVRVVSADRTTYITAKTATTKKTASGKLSVSADALRYVVGLSVRVIKSKTVRFVISHLLNSLTTTNGFLCEPLALDYVKSLKLLLNHRPHVEHFQRETWDTIVYECLHIIQDQPEATTDSDEQHDGIGSSRRSQAATARSGTRQRTMYDQVVDAIIGCLRSLTAASDIGLSTTAMEQMQSAIDFLNLDVASSNVNEDAFGLINNILTWATTENVKLITLTTPDLLSLVKRYWHLKLPSLKVELIILLVHIQPFVSSLALESDEPSDLRTEAKAVYDIVLKDYTRRAERDQLQLEDLRLETADSEDKDNILIRTNVFSLRCNRKGAEHNWAVLALLAKWTVFLSASSLQRCDSEDEGDTTRSRKRPRLTSELDELRAMLGEDNTASKITALQIATFLGQSVRLQAKLSKLLLLAIARCCIEENTNIASWAFLAAASLLGQCQGNVEFDSTLETIWQAATRALANSSICRASCHCMQVMLRLRLISPTATTELVQQFIAALDIAGPAILSDSSARLLQHILRIARTVLPGQADDLSLRVTAWITKKWTPSRFDVRAHLSSNDAYDMIDLRQLISSALNQGVTGSGTPVREWTAIGAALIQAAAHKDILGYLLLKDSDDVPTQYTSASTENIDSTVGHASLTAQTIILNHLLEDMPQAVDDFRTSFAQHARSLTTEACRTFCIACYIALFVSHDLKLADVRLSQRLRDLSNTLLRAIEDCASTSECSQDTINTILRLSIGALYRRTTDGSLVLATETRSATLIAQSVLRILDQRQRLDGHISQDFVQYSALALDTFESQDSRKSTQTPTDVSSISLDTNRYSIDALRCTISLHALILATLEDSALDAEHMPLLSKRVTEYFNTPSTMRVIAFQVLAQDMLQRLVLTQGTVHLLLSMASKQIISSYTYSRSTGALSAVLDFMVKSVHSWTDTSNRDLSNLGLDIYEWFVNLTLVNKVLEAPVQRKTADLLLAICRMNPDYGSQTTDMSARTSLFSLLRNGPISVQYYLAPRLTSIFKLYSVSIHDQIFDDLQSSLTVDTEWLEGITMRLYILAELGSTWHSLLRRCVYYIFETAGKVAPAAMYAQRCIARLTASLSLGSSVKLFALFSPQLLHTWLQSHRLESLPFAVFGYSSMEMFLSENQEEITAQLFLRQLPNDLAFMVSKLNCSTVELLSRAFDRVSAYAIGQDTTIVTAATGKGATTDNRLREALGKDRYKRLMLNNHGAIIGRILLATNRAESDEKWLDKTDLHGTAAVAVSEMKRYSQSTRPLPPSDEPAFTSKYLLHQLERLARRIGETKIYGLWTAASYTLASQILFDNTNDALGSIHSCAVIQKLRLLIALAGPTPLEGFPLEHTLRLLLPFVDDEQCADDVIGIMHYLLTRSVAYLSEHWTSLWSVSIHVVLRLAKHETISQQTPTQTSQQRETLLRMQKFRSWLLRYLESITPTLPTELQTDAKIVSDGLARSALPGNARAGSAESTLMLFLLRQEANTQGLLDPEDVREAMKFLASGFELPLTYAEDCLGDDSQALMYANKLWTVSRERSMDEGFVTWAALVAGRAFAASGSAQIFVTPSNRRDIPTVPQDAPKKHSSQRIIAELLHTSMRSSQAETVSVALSTMRACMANAKSDAERLEFQSFFPTSIVDVVVNTSSQYHRASATLPNPSLHDRRRHLQDVLAVAASAAVDDWFTSVALAICSLSQGSSFLKGLLLLLNHDSNAARALLPSMIHLVLIEDNDTAATLRECLSVSVQAHLSTHDDLLLPKQRFLIEMLLYLLNRVYPGEGTPLDRLKWLDCDYMIAAECADSCHMPTTALMLAEMARTIMPVDRRASSRASLTTQSARSISNELLLSIFQQVSEPDSYYGVEQPASLQSFLERSEYEGNAFQALLSRSAQLDDHLRTTHGLKTVDTSNMMGTLSSLNLDSLTFTLARATPANTDTCAAVMLDTARVLQQWDINISEEQGGESNALYRAFHVLNHASARPTYINALKGLLLAHVKQFTAGSRLSLKWASALSSMNEIMKVATDFDAIGSSRLCDLLHQGNTWMELADFDSLQTLIRSRSTIAGVLSGNKSMLESLQLSSGQVKLHEAKALVMLSDLARKHDRNELAMSAAWQLNSLANTDLSLTTMAQREIASVLSGVGESAASIAILRGLAKSTGSDAQAVQAGLLSQIGQQLADARLETPSEILQNYLKPSIEQLQSQTGIEAGKVFYTFAAFCDAQLQNPDALADFQRLTRLRQAKHDEATQLRAHVTSLKRTDPDYKAQKRNYERAMQWFEIDNEEYTKARNTREIFAEQSLKNYIHTLRACDKHDLCVLRLFALWLEYSDVRQTQATVTNHLAEVPTWKFVLLMNQLMSRLKGDGSPFDKTLLALLQSVCRDHPYHTVHHLYAARKFPGDDQASEIRRSAAETLCRDLAKDKRNGEIIRRMLKADSMYKMLAQEPRDGKNNGQYPIGESLAASKIDRHAPKEQVPSATIELALQPDGIYKNVPVITRFGRELTIMTGLSAPKVLTVYSSDGKHCKQLFKGGNDDLRQDAIMEQVFGEVSKMLRNHKASRQRNLQVRTYKVIPLTNRAGIIEFVPNSITINDFLQPAHKKYYPSSMKVQDARQKISAVEKQSTETRVKEFRKVCEQMPPVMRHFFFERFRDPDEWFAKRTAYTRTTAAISMLGQVLGLGDRHCQNILLDEHSGEVIHIDLGVAFEAGRVLPIPELVPFRLTRDIVDGMGVTGTEGIFKRCAEFTLDALRKDKDGIMTLLNVLRYDPLYSWTLSPVKAKRMQQHEGETNGTTGTGHFVSNKTESEAGEAERALSIVEKKLGNALSTAASVSEMIQQASDDRNLATLFGGWAAFF